jgi:hypothetical protein
MTDRYTEVDSTTYPIDEINADEISKMKNAEREADQTWEKVKAEAKQARARAETEARLTGQIPKSTTGDSAGYAKFSGQDRTSAGKGRTASEQQRAGSAKVEPKNEARVPSDDRQVQTFARGPSSARVPSSTQIPSSFRAPSSARVPSSAQIPSSNRVPSSGGRPLPSIPPLRSAASSANLRGSNRTASGRQAPLAITSARTASGQHAPMTGMLSRVASGSHGPAFSSPVNKQHQAVHSTDLQSSPMRSSPFRRADDEPAYAINLDRDTTSDSDFTDSEPPFYREKEAAKSKAPVVQSQEPSQANKKPDHGDVDYDSDAHLNLTAVERAVIKKYKAVKEEQRRSQEEAIAMKHRSTEENAYRLSQEEAMALEAEISHRCAREEAQDAAIIAMNTLGKRLSAEYREQYLANQEQMAKESETREMAASGIDPVEFEHYKDSGLSLDEWMEFKASGIDFDEYVQWKDSGLELDEWMDLNLSGLSNKEFADVKKTYRMSVMEFAEQKSTGLTAQEFVSLRKLGITAKEFVDVTKNRLTVQQFIEEQKAFESLTPEEREQCRRSFESATAAGLEYLTDAAEDYANFQYELAASTKKAPTAAQRSAESYAKEYQASVAPTVAESAKGSVLTKKISPLDLLKKIVSPLSKLSVDDEKVDDNDQDQHYESDGTDTDKSFMCADAKEHDRIQKELKGKDVAAQEDDSRSVASFGSYGCVGLEDDAIWERQVAKEPNVWEDPEYEAAYQSARIELDLENSAKVADLAYFDAYEREDVKDKFGRDTRPDNIVAAAKELALVTADTYSKAADAAGKLAYARVYGDRDYRDREFRDRVEYKPINLNLDDDNENYDELMEGHYQGNVASEGYSSPELPPPRYL